MVARQRDPAALIIGERLRLALEENGLSIRALAREMAGDGASESKVKTARRNLTRWKSGDAKPSRPNAEWLSRRLGQPMDRFLVSKAEAVNAWVELEQRVTALEAQLRDARHGPGAQPGGDR